MPKKQPHTPLSPLLLTTQQVADLLGSTAGSVRQSFRRGHLPKPKNYPGLGLRWPVEVIERWVAEAGQAWEPEGDEVDA
jgi:predicted DNA-binding transcriptional regulator AlpA